MKMKQMSSEESDEKRLKHSKIDSKEIMTNFDTNKNI